MAWVLRHPDWPDGKDFQPVQITGGYCWSTPFKVLEVHFLGEVCSAFLPSKKVCWAHPFRYLRVDQQYPGVNETLFAASVPMKKEADIGGSQRILRKVVTRRVPGDRRQGG